MSSKEVNLKSQEIDLNLQKIDIKSQEVDLKSMELGTISTEIPVGSKEIDSKSKDGFCRETIDLIFDIPHMLSDAWLTIFKLREGHNRGYILVCAFSTFVFAAMEGTFNGGIFALYVQKEPLSWTQDQISYFRSVSNLIRLFGATAGVILFKRVFKMSDSSIIVLAFASMIAQSILIMLSKTSWMLYLAAVTGALASLSNPCMQALVAKIMKPDEVGKAYGAFSMINSGAFLFATTAIGAIYHATVAYFPALIFLVCAAISCCAFAFTLWLHVDSNRGVIANCLKKICGRGRDRVYVVRM